MYQENHLVAITANYVLSSQCCKLDMLDPFLKSNTVENYELLTTMHEIFCVSTLLTVTSSCSSKSPLCIRE